MPNTKTHGKSHTKPHAPVARPSVWKVLWSVFGAGLGIWAVAMVGGTYLGVDAQPYMIGAFGASAVLLFGVPSSPLAQPYNLVVGHVLSAVIGVSAYHLLGGATAISMAAAVAVSIGAMQLTRSVHPPGGATALIAVIGGEPVHALGYGYIWAPVGAGVLVLLGVALMTNNFGRGQRWPVFWMPFAGAKRRTAPATMDAQPQER